jgi:hypothetical protein
MKILMLAVFNPESTNVSQAEAFERNNCDVIRYDYRACKNLKSRDQEIIGIVRHNKPKIVFLSKCNDIDISVVREFNKYSKTVLWYMEGELQIGHIRF